MRKLIILTKLGSTPITTTMNKDSDEINKGQFCFCLFDFKLSVNIHYHLQNQNLCFDDNNF